VINADAVHCLVRGAVREVYEPDRGSDAATSCPPLPYRGVRICLAFDLATGMLGGVVQSLCRYHQKTATAVTSMTDDVSESLGSYVIGAGAG